MKIRRDIFSFRNRVVVIIVGVSLGMVSLLYTNNMAKRLKEKEQHDVALWAHAMERANRNVMGGSMEDPLITDIVSNGNNIPFIMTNENLEVLQFHLVPEKIIDHPDRLRRQIDKFTAENTPRTVRFWSSNDHYHIIFYGRSALLKSLYYFPYVQILVITAFILLGFIAFRSSKHDEQNRVWIGLAKETAHQLGTPHLVVARVDRIPALAGRGSERRGGDEQRPHAPDEDRRPLLEDRLRNTPYPGQHQRSSGRVGHVFP